MKKKQRFYWDKKAQKAFKKLKWLFAEESILQIFNLRKQTVIKTDVSDQAQESVLSQLNKFENLHPVVFYLQKFINLKLNYKIYDKELLVIVKAFKQ